MSTLQARAEVFLDNRDRKTKSESFLTSLLFYCESFNGRGSVERDVIGQKNIFLALTTCPLIAAQNA